MQQKLEVFATAKEYIGTLIKGIEETIGYLRVGEKDKAYKLNCQIVEGVDWLIKALELTKDIQQQPIEVGEIAPLFAEVIEALENGDLILLADMYEYELLEKLNEWQERMNSTN